MVPLALAHVFLTAVMMMIFPGWFGVS